MFSSLSLQKKSYKSDDEDSDLDLEKELFSIGAYLNNRQEMVGQMFHSLRGATLKRHIPDILKVIWERKKKRFLCPYMSHLKNSKKFLLLSI